MTREISGTSIFANAIDIINVVWNNGWETAALTNTKFSFWQPTSGLNYIQNMPVGSIVGDGSGAVMGFVFGAV